MFKSDTGSLEEFLSKFGFSKDESLLYIRLLGVKSATAQEILKIEEFKTKKRPNIYKIINSLIEKKTIIEEEKEHKKVFFPIPPDRLINYLIDLEEKKFKSLKEESIVVLKRMSSIYETPKFSLDQIPEYFQNLIKIAIPNRWIVSENPFIYDSKNLGKIISLEFNTLRKLGADSAGIIIHEFRYPEHRTQKFEEVMEYQQTQLKRSLENIKNQGPIYLKEYWFEDAEITLPSQSKNANMKIKINEIRGKMNIPIGKIKGAFTSFFLEEFNIIILSVWAADFRDFMKIIENVSKKYSIFGINEN